MEINLKISDSVGLNYRLISQKKQEVSTFCDGISRWLDWVDEIKMSLDTAEL